MAGVDDLLLELQETVGCDYLSDLPRIYRFKRKIILDGIRKIPQEKYSKADWDKAAEYLTIQ